MLHNLAPILPKRRLPVAGIVAVAVQEALLAVVAQEAAEVVAGAAED